MSSFFVQENEALHRLIESQLEGIKSDVIASVPKQDVEALILGGGYGRGEGGVLRAADGPRPYNDYDLVLIHRCHDERRLSASLHEIHLRQSELCGIHVDITPIKASRLEYLPQTLTWCELVAGHQVLYGPSRVLLKMGKRDIKDVPQSEWGRLLFNRGTGLLLSHWFLKDVRLELFGAESFESFATRQVAKAWLSLGDVLLSRQGLYDSSVVNRWKTWLDLKDKPSWSENYLAAVAFKLEPVLCRPRADLLRELGQLSELYGAALRDLVAAEPRPLVGVYGTLRYVHPRRWPLSTPWRYPRERLRRALSSELGGDELLRERLVGSPLDYVKMWQRYG